MTRFLQTLDMCAFRANVTRLLGALSRNATIFQILVCAVLVILFCITLAAPILVFLFAPSGGRAKALLGRKKLKKFRAKELIVAF